MALKLRWVGEDELDRVAETRMYCFSSASGDLEMRKERLRADQRAQPGDFLLAERDGVAIGTTTALSMSMWVRGGEVPCQGIAYVGTIKTHRRHGRGGEKGVASQLMIEALRQARERGQVVSALMPFRASYYEHFGYGVVERRCDWTVPLAVLPTGDFEGLRFMKPEDLPLVSACRQRSVVRGQCDIQRTPQGWALAAKAWPQGYCVVDRPDPTGPVQSWMFITEVKHDGKTQIRVADAAYDSPAALLRQLHFLASLRDQYSAALLVLPVDLRLNWLLKETQLPHRPVEHAAAKMSPHTRMQIRILDHARFLEAVTLPLDVQGRVTVAVAECEGTISSFQIKLDARRARVTPATCSADVECTDRVWAAIASGDLPASAAAAHGLIQATDSEALKVLDALAIGPAPFCNEYF